MEEIDTHTAEHDAAKYLRTETDIAEYLKACEEESDNDPLIMQLANAAVKRARQRWATKHFHLGIDLEFALQQTREGAMDGALLRNGRVMTRDEMISFLKAEIEKGHRMLPMSAGCDNFDTQTGCRGHQHE